MLQRPAAPPPPEPSRRKQIWVYVAELGGTIGLGLVFMLLLLLLLQWIFPGGTGLGGLVRGGAGPAGATARLAYDSDGGQMVAVLTEVQRDVMDKPGSSVVWSTARSGIPLGDQHAVQTQAGSSATITFDENTVVELAEKSVIVVRKPRRVLGSRKRMASVVFMDGFLRGRVGSGPGQVELEVVTAGATVRATGVGAAGAALEVAVRDETSAVSVTEGTVELDWGGTRTQVPEGFMVTYDGTTAPGVPQQLPRAPRPVSPAAGQRFDYRSTPPPVEFDWKPVDDTRVFRLEVARDPEFTRPVYDAEQSTSGFVHENLEQGTYYWRVTPRRGPLAGESSAVRSLVVARDDEPPRLDVEFPAGPIAGSPARIRGTTEPGCRVFVGDTHAAVAADGSFEFPLEVRNGYNFVVVQSVDPTGNTAFRNHTILARLDGTEGNP